MTDEAWSTPRIYPLALDSAAQRVRTLELTESAYIKASFLDERLAAGGGIPDSWRDWAEAEAAAARLSGESDFIFHVGHVGSTLVSRLIGHCPAVLALREPALLRGLQALGPRAAAARLETLLPLYARVWREGQRSLVKVTSFVSEFGPAILSLAPTARAVLLFVRPEMFIAGILAGPATRAELPSATPARLARLASAVAGEATLTAPTGDGERAAAGWACEICALAAIERIAPSRTLWIEFDDFLAEPANELHRITTFLGLGASAAEPEALLRPGDLGRYSKAPEYPYSPAERRRILAAAFAAQRQEIEQGVRWINRLAGRSRTLAGAIRAAADGRRAPPLPRQ